MGYTTFSDTPSCSFWVFGWDGWVLANWSNSLQLRNAANPVSACRKTWDLLRLQDFWMVQAKGDVWICKSLRGRTFAKQKSSSRFHHPSPGAVPDTQLAQASRIVLTSVLCPMFLLLHAFATTSSYLSMKSLPLLSLHQDQQGGTKMVAWAVVASGCQWAPVGTGSLDSMHVAPNAPIYDCFILSSSAASNKRTLSMSWWNFDRGVRFLVWPGPGRSSQSLLVEGGIPGRHSPAASGWWQLMAAGCSLAPHRSWPWIALASPGFNDLSTLARLENRREPELHWNSSEFHGIPILRHDFAWLVCAFF